MTLPNGEEERREKLRELGARVRARREELGMSLEQVSDRTKIRSKYLIAVEEGDDSVSPGKTYFRAFLKTYSSFLGLDGTEFSNRYREIEEEAEAEAARPKDSRAKPAAPTPSRPPEKPAAAEKPVAASETPVVTRALPAETPTVGGLDSLEDKPHVPSTPARRRRLPGERRRKSSAVWVFLVLALVAAAAYYVAAYRPDILGLPGGQDAPPVAGDPSGGVPTSGGSSQGGPSTNPSTGSSTDPSTDPGTSGPATDPEPPAPKVTREDPNNETTVWSVDRTPVDVVLKLAGESDSYCWVSVTTDGEFAFERTLTPNEEVKLTAKSEIVLRAGKPWVMNVQVNGQDMGPAGEFGPVKDLVFKSTVTTQ